MKTLALIIALALSSCASTTFYRDGKVIARFTGDMTGTTYKDGETVWVAAKVDHSTATESAGKAVGSGIAATSAAALLLK